MTKKKQGETSPANGMTFEELLEELERPLTDNLYLIVVDCAHCKGEGSSKMACCTSAAKQASGETVVCCSCQGSGKKAV
jgi:hypothetical protein